MATTNGPALFRVGGSGFTVFHWANRPIGFAQTVSHQSPQPVAAPVAIQPMDQRYPLQIITPAAVGPGTLQVQMYEMYNRSIWDDMMALIDSQQRVGDTRADVKAGSQYNDLVEVFVRLANIGRGINCTKYVFPPNAVSTRNTTTGAGAYAETYHNCIITDIRNDEQIDIGTMDIVKAMTIQYTHMVPTRAPR